MKYATNILQVSVPIMTSSAHESGSLPKLNFVNKFRGQQDPHNYLVYNEKYTVSMVDRSTSREAPYDRGFVRILSKNEINSLDYAVAGISEKEANIV